ncbi:MAG: tetratricopeptide repeat protein [Candidatus Obscuribacterales bacterium]|jgi:tetratricopeptide (TPR) repeat protein|nr:tetratricopeptide repeat protein [Candidatus Obscuribacterales bacterium]
MNGQHRSFSKEIQMMLCFCTTAFLLHPAATAESTRTLSAEAKTSTAEVYLARKDWAKAEALLRKAYADAPDYPRASQLLGYVLYQQNKTAESIPYLKNAAEDLACPKRDQSLLLLGEILIQEKRTNEAIPYIQKAISLNPNELDSYKALYEAYRRSGNMSEAIKTGKLLLQRFPNCSTCGDLKSWLAYVGSEHQSLSLATASGASSLDNYFLETTATAAARWNLADMPIRVYIEPALKDSQWKPEYDTILKKAFQTWATASKNILSFQFVTSSKDAQIKCHWTSKADDLSESGEQGVARTSHVEHYLTHADVTILMADPRNSKVPVSTEIITKTCLHEIGHALGLSGHSPNPKDVMYFSEEDNGVKIVDLTTRDRKTIHMLYTQSLVTHRENTALTEKAVARAYTFDEGVKFINRKDYEGAVSCFTYVLGKNPSMSMARINLGIAYAGLAMQRDEESRFEEAEQYYKQALEIRHEIPDKHTLDAAVKNYAAMLKELGREADSKKVESEL